MAVKRFTPPLFLDMPLIMQIINRSKSQTYEFMHEVAKHAGKSIKYLTISDIAAFTKATKQEITDRIKGIMGFEEEQAKPDVVAELRTLRKAS